MPPLSLEGFGGRVLAKTSLLMISSGHTNRTVPASAAGRQGPSKYRHSPPLPWCGPASVPSGDQGLRKHIKQERELDPQSVSWEKGGAQIHTGCCDRPVGSTQHGLLQLTCTI